MGAKRPADGAGRQQAAKSAASDPASENTRAPERNVRPGTGLIMRSQARARAPSVLTDDWQAAPGGEQHESLVRLVPRGDVQEIQLLPAQQLPASS